VLSLRDPIHGFIRADGLETALIESAPLQRLRYIRQLGPTFLVFPGAEHSRFSHALGAMELAGRVYDVLAAKGEDLLETDPRAIARREVRAAALLHDIGHAPFSHSAEDLFADGIDHEEMTRRLVLEELQALFDRHGAGVSAERVVALLASPRSPAGQRGTDRLLSQIVSGQLDVDKMDYLLRDSLFCGVRYGSYDLERLLDTMLPLFDEETGQWGIGVEEGGVHALEALVLARYYMFTQVYFNVTVKVLELHLSEWLRETGQSWASSPAAFLAEDDVSVISAMRRSANRHAAALLSRRHYALAFETREHPDAEEKSRFEAALPDLRGRFGDGTLLVSNAAKDPHRLGESRVLVRASDGRLETMENASNFIRHLARIDRHRVYAPAAIAETVRAAFARELSV
jgi:HD superfamily phosphohydrolase